MSYVTVRVTITVTVTVALNELVPVPIPGPGPVAMTEVVNFTVNWINCSSDDDYMDDCLYESDYDYQCDPL